MTDNDNAKPIQFENFATRRDQIDSTIAFVLGFSYRPKDELKFLEYRLMACAIKMFCEAWAGYHAAVIRKAIKELEDNDCIALESAAYSHEELYN